MYEACDFVICLQERLLHQGKNVFVIINNCDQAFFSLFLFDTEQIGIHDHLVRT